MKLEPVGGIFWRLDSSGNLTAYDTAGTVLATFRGGLFSAQVNSGTLVQNVPITTTASLTAVHRGEGRQITPRQSGRILVLWAGFNFSSSIAGDGAAIGIGRTTGASNPAGGAAYGGGFIGVVPSGRSGVANEPFELSVAVLDIGLTLDQLYTYHEVWNAVTGGTATAVANANNFIVVEL